MTRAIAHRGPDGEGFETLALGDYAVALGHRRLAIQDVSPAGAQPMRDEATGFVLVYNGELYNVAELRASLLARGCRFRSHSDTELILAAYAQWGRECFARFAGMYAFALHAGDHVVLARDPLGIKPLYLSQSEDELLFASELCALEASGMVSPELSPEGLRSALAYGAALGQSSVLEAVRELEPGALCELRADGALRTQTRRFYSPPSPAEVRPFSDDDAPRLGALLEQSVREHLISDVPVGVFLSAGLDSTAMALLAARHQPALDAFTVQYDADARLDEVPQAERTARGLGLSHHTLSLSDADLLQRVERYFRVGDQPGVDGFNTFLVAGEVRAQGTVVALSGLGGDELLGGYDTFRLTPLAAMARRFLPLRAPWLARFASPVARRLRGANVALKVGAFLRAPPELLAMYLLQRRLFSAQEMQWLGHPSRGLDLPSGLALDALLSPGDAFSTVRGLELGLYMRSLLLRDSDVFGMAHGLELRVPMLDQRVVDFVLRRTRTGVPRAGKEWLVRALVGQWPEGSLGRTKTGFGLPFARWMQGPLRDRVTHFIGLAGDAGLVDPAGAQRVWQNFLADPRGGAWSRPWMLASLGAWVERRKGIVRAEH